jgi:homogentisate 1,2-dioxygenase
MPRAIPHTIIANEVSQFLVIESKTSEYREPDRGMVGRNAFYDSASFGIPDLTKRDEYMKTKKISINIVDIKHDDEMTRFTYEEDIYDVIGWKGDLYPLTLHCDDMMPMLSARVHLPPSAHTTFVAQGFIVCTFLPRPLESDSDALKVPFYHQNIDYDEVLFYHDGNFFSRDNLHAGMMTLHPAGFPHGPHPKAVQNIGTKTHTDETAVMIDTWNKLKVDENLLNIEVEDYWKSWMKK